MAPPTCANSTCKNTIEHKIASAKYCSDRCRKEVARRKSRAGRLNARQNHLAPEYRAARAIVSEKVEDEVREVMREEIRAGVTDTVRENVLGAAQTLTGLLADAVGVLASDLNHKDGMIRRNAAKILLQYGMPFANADATKMDSGNITIVHNIALPDTTFGQRVGEVIEGEYAKVAGGLLNPSLPYDAETNPELYEVDYPICATCKERKHPDMIVDGIGRCASCEARRSVQRQLGKSDED